MHWWERGGGLLSLVNIKSAHPPLLFDTLTTGMGWGKEQKEMGSCSWVQQLRSPQVFWRRRRIQVLQSTTVTHTQCPKFKIWFHICFQLSNQKNIRNQITKKQIRPTLDIFIPHRTFRRILMHIARPPCWWPVDRCSYVWLQPNVLSTIESHCAL